MNSFLVILIIIIILSILYLYYRNKQYNNILESFDNNTQSALSTYFQNTVDYDSYATNQNMYHATSLPQSTINISWDGVWSNKSLSIYAQFIQNNDKIIISLSNSSFDQIYDTIDSTTVSSTLGPIKCYDNSFVGIGRLNNSLSKFNLIEILCNNYLNPDLNLTINNFAGNLVNDTINLYSIGKGQVIPLKLKNRFSYYSNYAKKISPNTNTYPTIPNSEFVYEETPCVNSEPCMDKNHGLSVTTFNNLPYNACGKRTSTSNNTCVDKPSCVFYSPPPNGMQTCSFKSTVYDYMNFAPLSIQTQYASNSLLLCNFLNYFTDDKCNSCIICYVTNIGNVYTLNYEFFGTGSGESNLTVQADMMDQILNNPSSTVGLLPFYRNAIKDKKNEKDLMNGLLFTNCIENSVDILNSAQVNTCVTECNSFIEKYNGPIGNKLLKPCIWQINYNPTKNVLNSCPVILSTSQNYNTSIKYAEFNDDGTTNLSLFSGGLKQQLTFDKVNIIKENTTSSNTYVAMTSNLKAGNGLYLIPAMDDNGFYNSNVIRLVKTPPSNGKWLIIGFTLNNITELTNIINNINF